MAEDKVIEISLDKAGGINVVDDPQVLPLHVSDDLQNVFPGDSQGTIIQKRPGMSVYGSALAHGVVDMVAGGLFSTQTGTATSPDAIHVIRWYDASNNRYSFVNLNTAALVEPTTDIPFGGGFAGADHRLIMTNENHLLINPTIAGANWQLIEHYQNTTPWYRVTTYAAPSATATYSIGAYHRGQMCWANGMSVITTPWTVIFSPYDDPAGTFAAGDNFKIPGKSRTPGITGVHNAGDVTYWGAGEETYALSGATSETFRIDRVACDFGLAGMNGWAFNGQRSVGFTCTTCASASTTQYPPYMDNIGVLNGLQGDKIGWPVKTLLGTSYLLYKTRATTWNKYSGVFMFPAYFGTGANSGLFLDANLGFWGWSAGTGSYQATCYADGKMWLGERSTGAKLQYFDDTVANDIGTAFSAYWTKLLTSKMVGIDGDRKFQIQYARVYGTQTSGTAPTIQIDTDEAGSYSTAVSCALAKSGTNVSLLNSNKAGYVQRFKITFGADGVKQKIYRIVLGIKAFPGR